MKFNWRNYWIPALIALVLVLGVQVALEVIFEIGQPFGGFYAHRNHARKVWQVEASTPPWWLARTPVHYDDVLLTIEGQVYDISAREAYTSADARGQKTVQITVRRAGETQTLAVPLQHITLSTFLDIKLPDFLSGLGFWWLAVVVYRARPRDPVNRLFAIATSLSAASLWLSIPTLFPESDPMSRFHAMMWVITSAFVGASFIHLSWLFPVKVRRLGAGWVMGLYLVMAMIAGGFVISMVLRWWGLAPDLSNLLGAVGNTLVIGTLGLGVVVFLARLGLLMIRRTINRRERRQVNLLFLGIIFAVPFILVVVLRVISQTTASYFTNGLDLRYLVLAVPLSFAFVILRYQTFQSPRPVLVGVFMLGSSALIASFGAWLIRLAEPEWANLLNWTPFVPIFLAAFLSGLFWSTQSAWFGTFRRVFGWEQRSYEAVQQFAQQTASELDLSVLPGTMATALVKNFELELAAVWLWEDEGKTFELAALAGEYPSPRQNRVALPDRLRPHAWPPLPGSIRILSEGGDLPSWLSPLQGAGIEVVTPLGEVGLLGLGKRWDEEIFEARDLGVVELIGQQAALFLLTAQQVAQLRRVPTQIADAQERERFKIAQELHDTIQQFLGSLPFYLELARTGVRANPAEAEAVLARCLAEVEGAAQTVRQIRNNLAPLQLEVGLIRPLETLVEHFRTRTGVAATMDASPEVDTALTVGARHALYRVVQQALDNVAAHAQASHVQVSLSMAEGLLNFSVVDDGVGSSVEGRALAVERGSFGVTSMQARITALGGGFGLESEVGRGTRVWGWLGGRE